MVSDLAEKPKAERRKNIPLWWGTFLGEYIRNGGNARQAYLIARPETTVKTADTLANRLLNKVEFVEWRRDFEQAHLSRAEKWQNEQLTRCERYRGDIDETRRQFMPTPESPPVIDPVAIKCLSQAEETNDRIARRSLGLDKETKPTAVNINVFSALGNVRERLIEEAEVTDVPSTDKMLECDVG